MKNLILLTMMFFSSSLLFAADEFEDNETQTQEHWEITEGLSIEANRVRYPLIGLSFSQPFLESFQIFSEAQYRWDWFALSGGLSWIHGFFFNDHYLSIYMKMNFGWFYLKGGTSIALDLKQAGPSNPPGFSYPIALWSVLPILGLGLDLPIATIGSGVLKCQISTNYVITDNPQVEDLYNNFGLGLSYSIHL